ncbi:RagB/SusD family nutrient uptake outer membrane protein [Oceanihabitans sediminis]|uniref:RagB/SusD family nutrient uptake outer membrane protein n=1 Tax=Oceanihabitans sediminis TaxID=1812012 RepID=UPI00299DAAB1|nr:RagB/SusD family nutrient uptake outer membrane protein [Oceanihabitans sediminis]MDX1773797.1 RagB/SusD family nutrient uptake outer membrane protein [Oceanihabitans sediminis]
MKKYLYISIFAIGALFSSCDDNLDKTPFSSVGENDALTSEIAFENATLGLYTLAISPSYYGEEMMSFPDVISDNLIFSAEGRGTQKAYHEWQFNENITKGGFMAQAYAVVRHANFILDNIDNIPQTPARDHIQAQALAMRALSHFNITNTFSKIPTQDAGALSSLGMPYVTSSDILQEPGSRGTVEAIYNGIINDLETAKNLVGADDIIKINKNAINGLLSRVYLYRGMYAEAAAAADDVTASVATFGNFPGVWDDSSDDGVLFKLKNLDADTGVSVNTPYSQTVSSGVRSEYVVDFDLFNLYGGTDIRKATYVETSAYNGKNYNHVAKHMESSINLGSGVVDVKVIRMAEVMLNKAEALAMPGPAQDEAAALAALDAVRSQRYSSFVSGNETGQALLDAIALERRLELAFEGHRFYDIKRSGEGINRSGAGQYADGTGLATLFTTLPAGDCKFQLPIPKTEMDVNPNMEQNPCYN